MDLQSTILAISSPPGPGLRAIVRLSGPHVFDVIDDVLTVSPWDDGTGSGGPMTPSAAGRGMWRARFREMQRDGTDSRCRGGDRRVAAEQHSGPPGASGSSGESRESGPPGAPGPPFGLLPSEQLSSAGLPSGMPCLVLLMPGTANYTGEPSAELMVPGSSALTDRICRGLLELGRARGWPIRLAGPGEFTARAWLHGRMSVGEAEAVAATIAANDAVELQAAHRLAGGGLTAAAASIAGDLADVAAAIEAGIDFSDEEDVVTIAAGVARDRLAAARERLQLEAPGRAAAERRDDGTPTIVLTGPTNAGKSTLFNALVGGERTIASPEPDTTRDVIESIVDDAILGRVRFVDTAGVDQEVPEVPGGPGAGGVPAQMRAASAAAVAVADLLLECLPAGGEELSVVAAAGADADAGVGVGVGAESEVGAGGAGGAGDAPRRLRILTKVDVLSRTSEAPWDASVGRLPVSARSGAGLIELRERIRELLSPGGGSAAPASVADRPPALLERYAAESAVADAELAAALGWVTVDAQSDPRGGLSQPEIVATHLRLALDAVGRIAGAVPPDEVLGRIFSSFCIGK
ncbi:MAG: GTPase [Phycisphaerales bacterium]